MDDVSSVVSQMPYDQMMIKLEEIRKNVDSGIPITIQEVEFVQETFSKFSNGVRVSMFVLKWANTEAIDRLKRIQSIAAGPSY